MIFISALAFLFAILALISFKTIKKGKGTMWFIYKWGFPAGAFVWEDLFVFSVYGIGVSLVTILTNQLRLGALLFIVFWIVRSAGETLYFFLQQFIQPKHHPHFLDSHFTLIKRVLGPITYQQCLILLQLLFQVILMIAIVCLILLLQAWDHLP